MSQILVYISKLDKIMSQVPTFLCTERFRATSQLIFCMLMHLAQALEGKLKKRVYVPIILMADDFAPYH